MQVSRALAAACIAIAPAVGSAQDTDVIEAQVKTAEGESAGTVTFEQVEHGVVVTARLENLPQGPHGFHVHERGVCEPPDFQSAGGHYAPQGDKHGFDTPDGYHAGDLPNVYVAGDGTATADFFKPDLTLAESTADPSAAPFTLQDQDGSAIMIHADIDDYRASTPDSTGPRIACGVIAPPQG
jgi:superoxide dismutase, Cu-Zn family